MLACRRPRSQTFTEATENSCNVVFATLGTKLGKNAFTGIYKHLGLEAHWN